MTMWCDPEILLNRSCVVIMNSEQFQKMPWHIEDMHFLVAQSCSLTFSLFLSKSGLIVYYIHVVYLILYYVTVTVGINRKYQQKAHGLSCEEGIKLWILNNKWLLRQKCWILTMNGTFQRLCKGAETLRTTAD